MPKVYLNLDLRHPLFRRNPGSCFLVPEISDGRRQRKATEAGRAYDCFPASCDQCNDVPNLQDSSNRLEGPCV